MNKIPIGEWIQKFVELLTNRYETEFRLFSDFLNDRLGLLIQLLAQIRPELVILIIAGVVYLKKRNWKNVFLSLLGLLTILNLGYWRETLETALLVTVSTLLSASVGIPVGIFCAHRKRVYRFLHPVLDIMQTLPTFVYLIPTLMLFGLGLAPAILSTIIFAMPATIRMTYLGMSEIPPSILEVADAFGSTKMQKLFKVEIPYALPAIKAGISQCMILSLSMIVIAALVGADGLGKPVVQALNTINIAKGFEAGLVIVIVAIWLDRAFANKQTKDEPHAVAQDLSQSLAQPIVQQTFDQNVAAISTTNSTQDVVRNRKEMIP